MLKEQSILHHYVMQQCTIKQEPSVRYTLNWFSKAQKSKSAAMLYRKSVIGSLWGQQNTQLSQVMAPVPE